MQIDVSGMSPCLEIDTVRHGKKDILMINNIIYYLIMTTRENFQLPCYVF